MDTSLCGHIYDNKTLHLHFETEELEGYKQSIYLQYLGLTKVWDDKLNTEWIARHYQATKMILSATLMLNSATYAEESNLKVVEPYLYYYAILTCSRALVLTLPALAWGDGNILQYTHKKTINITEDTFKLINAKFAADLRKKIIKARDYRELFSYRFPLNGLRSLPDSVCISHDETIDICTTLLELAQFNSEEMERAYRRHCKEKTFGYNEDVLWDCITYRTEDESFIDNDDYQRIGSIVKRAKELSSLQIGISFGIVEDFFGSWSDSEDTTGLIFNPDLYNNIIFDLP